MGLLLFEAYSKFFAYQNSAPAAPAGRRAHENKPCRRTGRALSRRENAGLIAGAVVLLVVGVGLRPLRTVRGDRRRLCMPVRTGLRVAGVLIAVFAAGAVTIARARIPVIAAHVVAPRAVHVIVLAIPLHAALLAFVPCVHGTAVLIAIRRRVHVVVRCAVHRMCMMVGCAVCRMA